MADYVSNYSGDQIDEAVGRALPGGALDTGKAPAGFGLGSASTDKIITSKAELDAIRVNGWCYYSSTEPLVNEANARYATIRTDTSGRTVTQTAYLFLSTLYQNCTLQRTLLDTVASTEWGAWEWVNPPMILGWEYRTTERYLGKPVYARVINAGYLPNASGKYVEHGIANIQQVVDAKLLCTNADVAGDYTSVKSVTGFGVDKWAYYFDTSDDRSTYTANIVMKYTKTTD